MIALLPIAAEGERRTRPRVTLAIIVLATLVQLLAPGDASLEAELEKLTRIATWELEKARREHPALEALAGRTDPVTLLLDEEAWAPMLRDPGERTKLAGLAAELRELRNRHPYFRFGLVPARLRAWMPLSHMFLHADLIHLGLNMLFLWIVGALLEDDWGGARFLGFYLASGAAATLPDLLFDSSSSVPRIGASGAIAGMLGAFLVTRARTPIRVALIAGLLIRIREVPSWVFLGSWIAGQLFWLALAPESLGIGFSAHVAGFAFGAGGAALGRSWLRRGAA